MRSVQVIAGIRIANRILNEGREALCCVWDRAHRPVGWLNLLVFATLLLLPGALLRAQEEQEDSHWRTSGDRVAVLWKRMEAGKTSLDTSSDKAFLRSLLKALDVPVESQVLVFSKTSLQKALISPSTPRAIYFNEECYVGWVQGGDLEVVASDPRGNFQYYVIQRPADVNTPPRLLTSNQCMSCHVGGELQIQSVHARASGYPMGNEDRFVTTYTSPLKERWGGWYVTGLHGTDLHMGNVTAKSGAQAVVLDRRRGANVESLKSWFPIEPYLVDTSDLVSLMVLEHQYVVHNALHDASRAVRRTLERTQGQLPHGPDAVNAAAQVRILDKQAEKLVELLLYAGEYQLQKGGVVGGVAFQKAFQRNRKMSSQGASLKDFDLRSRLFKHRCSYMIHSASFTALPALLKARIYARLNEILSGDPEDDSYGYLEREERLSIRQILMDTEPDIRACWESEKQSR